MDHGGCLMEKIGDFGLVMEMTDEGTTDEEDGIRGTKSYLAPESTMIDNYLDWPIDHMNTWICSVGDVTRKRSMGSKPLDPNLLTHIGYSNELLEIPNDYIINNN